MTASVPRVARKSATVIQEGSVYKEHWTMGSPLSDGATVRQEFRDSSGALVAEVTGEVDGYYIDFAVPYADVQHVPNGAGFYTYVQLPEDAPTDEHLVRYGTVFRRQLFFPDSPATLVANLPRRYEDTFQRPAGPVGGRWKVLVGRPKIFDNTEWFTGVDHPNTVGPDYAFFSRYFIRYYVPFASDSVELSISATKKGTGQTVIALCCSSDGSSYLFARLNAATNKVDLGIGTGADIGVGGNLASQVTPVNLTVPGDTGMGTYKIRYDDVTKKITFYNADYTDDVSWIDSSDVVPHGKGYRYFAIGGQSALLNSGVQVAYINAADVI